VDIWTLIVFLGGVFFVSFVDVDYIELTSSDWAVVVLVLF